MHINIKELTKQQLLDLQSQIEKQLATKEFPPKGTICWVWDNRAIKYIKVADGKGEFYNNDSTSEDCVSVWKNYEVIPMGISFSDEVITSEQITPEMDKMLCLCWDNNWKAGKYIRVIDSNDMSTFIMDGTREGQRYNNYRLCTTPIGNLPSYYRDMIEACED